MNPWYSNINAMLFQGRKPRIAFTAPRAYDLLL